MNNDQSSYDAGFAAGRASRDEEFEGLQRVADYWYFRALNPHAKTMDQKLIETIIDGMEANEERKRKWHELDDIELLTMNNARDLIRTTDMTDIQIAVKVGLFAPTVANLRTEMARIEADRK